MCVCARVGEGPPVSPGTPPLSEDKDISCAGPNQPCHMWGAGFGDRNGFFLLEGSVSTGFIVQSWPLTKSVRRAFPSPSHFLIQR